MMNCELKQEINLDKNIEVHNNQEKSVKSNRKRKIIKPIILYGGALLLCYLVCYFGMKIYYKYRSIPELNYSEQGLLYDEMNKSPSSMDNNIFYDILNMPETPDNKNIQDFLITMQTQSNLDNLSKNMMEKIRKFTHEKWKPFQKLLNFQITGDQKKKIVKIIGSFSINRDPAFLIEECRKIKTILDQDNHDYLIDLYDRKSTLLFLFINYWNYS